MATERPTNRRFGIRIEPDPSQQVKTPWDRESINSVTHHFLPFFDEIKPIAAYLRIGEDLETEHEDLSLLADPRKHRKLPILDVLHLVTFVHAPDELAVELRLYDAMHEWSNSKTNPDQQLNLHFYPLPFPTTIGLIDTLEKAHAHFNITPEDHEQIWPHFPK